MSVMMFSLCAFSLVISIIAAVHAVSRECGKSTMNPNDDLPLINRDHISFKVDKPWMAAIYLQTNGGVWKQMCAGTLVSYHAVITAAHCLTYEGRQMEEEGVRVGLGKLNRSYYQQENDTIISNVNYIYLPENYRGVEDFYNLDIAILVLSTSLVPGKYNIMPVCIMYWSVTMEPKQDEVGYLASWMTTEDNTRSDVLRWDTWKSVKNDSCLTVLKPSYRKFITPDKFCAAGVTGGNGSYIEASGGGLTMLRNGTHYLYGVMSIKPHDDNQNIRLFTDVLSPAHRDWIIMNDSGDLLQLGMNESYSIYISQTDGTTSFNYQQCKNEKNQQK